MSNTPSFKMFGSGEIKYTDHVRNEISKISIDKIKIVDLSGEPVAKFRMTMGHVKGRDQTFTTKIDEHGFLWVKRIK